MEKTPTSVKLGPGKDLPGKRKERLRQKPGNNIRGRKRTQLGKRNNKRLGENWKRAKKWYWEGKGKGGRPVIGGKIRKEDGIREN